MFSTFSFYFTKYNVQFALCYSDGILLGGILLMYELHNFLRPLLFLMYSFWVPQIVTNVIRDTRKPLHPQYILGMTITRLAIPLYIFGCPSNFMRIEPDKTWCIAVTIFMGIQAAVLLLQHYFGSRCFIPHQVITTWSFLNPHTQLICWSFLHAL